ncbi:hypothetical protein FQN54_000716 [Arachnomyces sp. PD_36]|nr:hypothetical protein FQN54_000716 [Arachnomyces sp. PD_36]
MAEVLGIVAALIAIGDAGGKISKSLYTLGRSLSKAKSQINELARELLNISSAFTSLAEVLRNSQDLLKPAILDTTQAVLDDCERTYAEIEENVGLVERQSLRARERAQWPFRKAKVKQLKSRLESFKGTLNLMVNILNLSAGVQFLQQRKDSSPQISRQIEEDIQQSEDSVVEAQLAFDKAERYERQLAERKSREQEKSFESGRSQSGPHETALVKHKPIQDLVMGLPGFDKLSLVSRNQPQREEDGKESPDGDHGSGTLVGYNKLEHAASNVVRDLCYSWTRVRQIPDNRQNPKDSRTGVFKPKDERDYARSTQGESSYYDLLDNPNACFMIRTMSGGWHEVRLNDAIRQLESLGFSVTEQMSGTNSGDETDQDLSSNPKSGRSPSPSPSLNQRNPMPTSSFHDGQLEHLASKLHDEIAPKCAKFLAHPPKDWHARDKERVILSERILSEIILKLDGLEVGSVVGGRQRRKDLIREAQKMLHDLDATRD